LQTGSKKLTKKKKNQPAPVKWKTPISIRGVPKSTCRSSCPVI
jgi:hypothetical protein